MRARAAALPSDIRPVGAELTAELHEEQENCEFVVRVRDLPGMLHGALYWHEPSAMCCRLCIRHIASYTTGIEVNAKLHSHTSSHPSRDAIYSRSSRRYPVLFKHSCHQVPPDTNYRVLASYLHLRGTAILHGNFYLDQINNSEEEAGTFFRNVRTDMTLHSTIIWATPFVGPSALTGWVVGRLRLPVGKVRKARMLIHGAVKQFS
jgi:hypothetical protein